jgi:hypothetical protein
VVEKGVLDEDQRMARNMGVIVAQYGGIEGEDIEQVNRVVSSTRDGVVTVHEENLV